jgi:hypothetical protein
LYNPVKLEQIVRSLNESSGQAILSILLQNSIKEISWKSIANTYANNEERLQLPSAADAPTNFPRLGSQHFGIKPNRPISKKKFLVEELVCKKLQEKKNPRISSTHTLCTAGREN